MKKIRWFIKNIYRVKIMRPGSGQTTVKVIEQNQPGDPDSILRDLMQADCYLPHLEADIQRSLEQRVANKGRKPIMKSNSFANMISPLFSIGRNIELKMAAITLAVIMFMRIGPVVNHNMSRNIQPVILADTLIDSSAMILPFRDSSANF